MTALGDDVVHHAYLAHRGDVTFYQVETGFGCARCGWVTDQMTPVGQVVSKRFTGYESWTDRRGRRLCAACTWAYTHRALRTHAHTVTRDPATTTALTDPTALLAVLSGPLGADTAVIVPLMPGRKHLLPDAQWGRVTVDDLALDWTDADRDRLTMLAWLRERGFTETELAAAQPAYRTLTAIDPAWWPRVFDTWTALSVWRTAPPWWHLALRATRGVSAVPGARA